MEYKSTEESSSGFFESLLQIIGVILYTILFLLVTTYWLTSGLPTNMKEYPNLVRLITASEFWRYLLGLGVLTFVFTLFMQYFYPKRGAFIKAGLTLITFTSLSVAISAFTYNLLRYSELDQWHPGLQAVAYLAGILLAVVCSRYAMKSMYRADESCNNMDDLTLEVLESKKGEKKRRTYFYESPEYNRRASGYYLPLVACLFTMGFLFATSPLLGLLLLPYMDNLPEMVKIVSDIIQDFKINEQNRKHHLAMVGTVIFGTWVFMVFSKHLYFFIGLLVGEMRKNAGFGAALLASLGRLFTCTATIIGTSFTDLLYLIVVPFYYAFWFCTRYGIAWVIDSITGSKMNLTKRLETDMFWETVWTIIYTIFAGIVLNTIYISWICLGMHTSEFVSQTDVKKFVSGESYSTFLGVSVIILAILLVFSLIEVIAMLKNTEDPSYLATGYNTIAGIRVGNIGERVSGIVETLKSNSRTSKVIRTLIFFILAAVPSVYQLLLGQRQMANALAHRIHEVEQEERHEAGLRAKARRDEAELKAKVQRIVEAQFSKKKAKPRRKIPIKKTAKPKRKLPTKPIAVNSDDDSDYHSFSSEQQLEEYPNTLL